jgi:hypothetical protein
MHLPTRRMEANASTDYLLRHKIYMFGSIDLRQDFSCSTRELRPAVLTVGKDAKLGEGDCMRGPLRRREYIRGRTRNSRKLIRVFKNGRNCLSKSPRFRTRRCSDPARARESRLSMLSSIAWADWGHCELVKRFAGR